jgi:hypothetical protein
MMMDLNGLIQPDSSLYLLIAQGINDSGEIVGTAIDTSTGAVVAYLAVPSYGGESEAESSKTAGESLHAVVVPDDVRRQLTGFSRLVWGEGTK